MEETLSLEQLVNSRNEAFAKYDENEKATIEAIKNYINENCRPEGFELIFRLSHHGYERNLEFAGEISFKTDDPERIKKGWDDDFGSDFDIYITSDGIKINKGTCGSYTLKDKYQIARDRILCKIWDHHDEIVKVMTDTFNSELYKAYRDIDWKIRNIEADLKAKEEERKAKELLDKLNNSKYLAEIRKSNIYSKDYLTVIGTNNHYTDLFVIEKITDKSIIGHYDLYYWQEKRLNKGQVLSDLKWGRTHMFTEMPQDYKEFKDGYSEEDASK